MACSLVRDRVSLIVFVMPNPAYVRNFEGILRGLGSRGHTVTVLFEGRKPADQAGLKLMVRLTSEYQGLSYELQPDLPLGARGRLRLGFRALQYYLRYFEPPYGH